MPAHPQTDKYDDQQVQSAAVNALQNLDESVVILDMQWRYMFVNKIGWKTLGKKPYQVLGKEVWDVFPELVDSNFYQAAHRAMVTQQPTEIEEYYPFRRQWFSTKFYPCEKSLVAQMRDITELKEEQAVNIQLSGSLEDAMQVYWHGKYGHGPKAQPAN